MKTNNQNKFNNILTKDYIDNNYGFALLHFLNLNNQIIWSVLEFIPSEFNQKYFKNIEDNYNLSNDNSLVYKCIIVNKGLISEIIAYNNNNELNEEGLNNLLKKVDNNEDVINLENVNNEIELYDIWNCDNKIIFQSYNWGVVRLKSYNILNIPNIEISEEYNKKIKKEIGIEIKEYNLNKFFVLFPNPIYRELEVRLIPESKNVSLEFIPRKNKTINSLKITCMGRKQDEIIELYKKDYIELNYIEISKDFCIKEISLEIRDLDNQLIDEHPFASFIGG